MVDKNIMVDGLAVLWEEVLEFVGSKVCLDGNARHAIAHRSAQANKCLAKWRPVLKSSWLPRLMRLNIVKSTMWQAFLWSASVWTTIKAQRETKIASWSARLVANVIGAQKPPWLEMDQWWRQWHRTGHRWIEKCNMNAVSAIRERALSWAGHVARMDYKKGSRGVEDFHGGDGDFFFNGKKRRKTSVWPASTAFQNLQVGGHGGGWRFPNSLGMQTVFRNQLAASCSRPCELQTVC